MGNSIVPVLQMNAAVAIIVIPVVVSVLLTPHLLTFRGTIAYCLVDNPRASDY